MDYDRMKATKVSKKKYDGGFEVSRSTKTKAKRTLSKAGISIVAVIL